MKRVAILGNAGGGKSTLARRMGAALGLPVVALDGLLWRDGWTRTPEAEFVREHERCVAEERWIVEGVAYWSTLAPRLRAADTIVLVDFPRRTHLWLTLKRVVRLGRETRPEIPARCPEWRAAWKMVRIVFHVHRELRPKILALVEAERTSGKAVHHLRTPAEWKAFARRVEAGAGERSPRRSERS